MSATDTAWAVCVGCLAATTVLLGMHVYELHRCECTVSSRRVQVAGFGILAFAAALTAIVLNLTT